MVSNRLKVVECVAYFFSSRRRHTRSYGDWSSDVCSSDLGELRAHLLRAERRTHFSKQVEHRNPAAVAHLRVRYPEHGAIAADHPAREVQEPAIAHTAAARQQIGRASCRERG